MSTTPPMIAHVHVPKTAGSTINAALAATLGSGKEHIQGIIDDAAAFAETVQSSNWIAGHVPTPRLRVALSNVGVDDVRFVTALREPVSQIASHYNWLIEIGHRGEPFLHGHPPAIIDIHHHISLSDNTDPNVVIANLRRYSGLFMNCQAKHVVGEDFVALEADYSSILARFDTVVLSDDVAAGLMRMLARPVDLFEYRNKSPYHFEPKVFHDNTVEEFLQEHNRYDNSLWKVAKEAITGQPQGKTK